MANRLITVRLPPELHSRIGTVVARMRAERIVDAPESMNLFCVGAIENLVAEWEAFFSGEAQQRAIESVREKSGMGPVEN